MSKKLVEGTIKIASVGMAAVMATTPMATLAADADVVSSDAQPTVEDTQTNQADEKQEIKEAAVAVADAQTAVEGANDLMDTALASNEAMGEGAITELPTATIPEGDVDAAEGELEDLAQNISDMKDANTEADAAEAENNGYIADAGEVASDLNADMSTAASDFAARRDAMNNATTTDDTDAAYAQAVAIADAAQAEFNAKSAEYDAILQKISDNNAVIQAAQERYDEAVANASENLEDAKTELAAAKQLATELEAAAEAKKNELLKSGAAAIIAAQDADFEKNGKKTGQKEVDWNYKAKIMTAIIEKFYVPNELKGTNAKATRVQVGEDKVGKEASTDGNAHYYQVTYKDDKGVKHTDYLNYKLDANGDIIIFQKVEKTIDLYRYKVTTVKPDGKTSVAYYEEEQVDGKSVIRMGNNVYDVATIGTDKYVVLSDGEEDTDTKIKIGDTENNGLTEVTAINSGDAEVVDEYIDANGKLVKVSQVKGSVTKVTKTDKSLNGSGLVYDSLAEAQNAANKAVDDDLEDGESLVTDSVSYTTSSEETYSVTYTGNFTGTIDIKEWTVDEPKDWNPFTDEERMNRARADFAKQIQKAIEDAGFTVVGTIDTSGVKLHKWWFLNGSLTENTWVAVGNTKISVSFKKDNMTAANVVTQNGASATEQATQSANAALTKYIGSAAYTGTVTNVNATKISEKYAYGNISYKAATQEVLDNQLISETTTTYEAAKLDHLQAKGMYGNDNYNAYLVDGNEDHIVMFENKETGKDLGLNNFLEEYKGKKTAYENLASQAQAAKDAYVTAEEKVNAIQASIDALKEQAKVAGLDANQIALQAELTVALEQAERDMTEAEETLKGITGQLTALLTERNARILALTPAPAAPAAAVAAPGVAAAPVLAAVPGAGVAAAAPALVPGADVAAPQANVQLDNNNNVTANDVQTSLANMTLDDVTEANTIMGWWWLLIIALLGGTGYTMYRKHQQKKAAQTIDKTK